MTLLELKEAVVSITRRPDLRDSLITLAVQEATRKMHSFADHKRDIVISDPITLDNSTNLNRYVIPQSAPELIRPRKFKMIMEELATNVQAGYNVSGYHGQLILNELDIKDIFDTYNIEKVNYFYIDGTNITLASQRAMSAVRVVYQQFPDTSIDTFSSWIANSVPHAIYHSAAAQVFQSIGKTAEYTMYKGNENQNMLEILKQDTGE